MSVSERWVQEQSVVACIRAVWVIKLVENGNSGPGGGDDGIVSETRSML